MNFLLFIVIEYLLILCIDSNNLLKFQVVMNNDKTIRL